MRKYYLKRIFIIVTMVILMTAAGSVTAMAHTIPDTTKSGSVSITFQDPDSLKPVTGGSITMYRVGDVKTNNGNYFFALTENFSASRLPLNDLEYDGLADKLFSYAQSNKINGDTLSIDNNGIAAFSELKPGLYLFAQNNASKGYNAVSPFLVSLPAFENGEYVYDIDATPKMESLTVAPEDPTKPQDPTNSKDPTNPQDPTAPATPGGQTPTDKLPQMGQLNWPVPVLALLGLISFAIGWIIFFSRKGKNHAS